MRYNIEAKKEVKAKRLALGATPEEMAEIAKVPVDVYVNFENGSYIDSHYFKDILNNVESHIRAFDREKYILTRIKEETILLEIVPQDVKAKVLAHIMVHTSKLQMMYLD